MIVGVEREKMTDTDSRLTELVRASGITQAHLARHLGVSRQSAADRLAGRTRWLARELPLVADAIGATGPWVLLSVFGEDPDLLDPEDDPCLVPMTEAEDAAAVLQLLTELAGRPAPVAPQ